MEQDRPSTGTVAAVDLGSNSFHMLLARVDGEQPVIIDRLREMVQLASGLTRKKRLSKAAVERAVECLERFGQRVRHLPAGAVRAVGTNTLRTATNASEFLGRAEEALGHPIETIAGIEEARLIYLGVCQSLPDPSGRRLVIDIGGGSTELIVGEGFSPVLMESLYLGCVSMGRRFFPDGKITRASWARAGLAAEQEFVTAAARFRKVGWEEAVGSSGTIRAAESAIQALGGARGEITPTGLDRLREFLLDAGHVKKIKLPGLTPRRRNVFPGGVVVLSTAARTFELQRIRRSDGALREGLLYDLLGRIRREDVRSRSVRHLADRYHVDREQAARVEQTAETLLDAVKKEWNLTSPRARLLLGWAAQLHEIGLDVAHSHYHKHGEYIIAAVDLPGFTLQEQRRLATLIRSHRRKFPSDVFEQFPGKTRRRMVGLAILLRLAVLFHRARSNEPLPAIDVRAGKRSLELRFPAGWLETHPLTLADLQQEAGYVRVEEFRLDAQ